MDQETLDPTLPIAGLASTPRRLGWRRTAWSFVSRYL